MGNRSSKVDSNALAAFDSLNFLPLASVGVETTFRTDFTIQPPKGYFVFIINGFSRNSYQISTRFFRHAILPYTESLSISYCFITVWYW